MATVHRVTWGVHRGITEGYTKLLMAAQGYMGYTGSHKATQGYTVICRGKKGNYTGLHKATQSYMVVHRVTKGYTCRVT